MNDMKKVVEDILNMFNGNMPEITDEWCDELGSSIATMLKHRLQDNEPRHNLRLSALGQGDRKLWYSVRPDTPKEELRAETRIKFLYGDIIELVYIALIRLSGHEVTNEQDEVELEGIKGHIDCKVDGVLVDIKSASSFSFNKFKDEKVQQDDPFGYYAQMGAYAEATQSPVGGWFVMDKQLGKLCFSQAFEAYVPNMRQRAIDVKAMVKEAQEPRRCAEPVADGKSGNMKLPTICSYCDFKKHCYRDANNGQGLRTFLYAGAPRFLTTVVKTPNVQEKF